MPTPGFVIALTWEQQLLRRHLPPGCLIELSGMGSTAAAAAAQRLLQRGAELLVSCGCCAGLMPELRAGDVLLANQLVDESGELLDPDAAALALLQQQLTARLGEHQHAARCLTGRLLSVTTAIACSEHKQTLARRHQAMAADMESFAIASVAAEASVAFVAARVVLDDLRQPLPTAISSCCDDYGIPAVLPLLRACWQQPALLAELGKLARSRSRAASSLKALAKAWPEQYSPTLIGNPAY